jgi:hypothetical protein
MHHPADTPPLPVYDPVMAHAPVTALTREFLAWVAFSPRTYGDVIDAWRTTCPRMTVWEDAVSEHLVALENGGAMRSARVFLTARGKAALSEPN